MDDITGIHYCLILDPPPDLIASTGFAGITPDSVPFTYLYHVLTTDEFVEYLTLNATGAAYPAVNASDSEYATVLLPSRSSLSQFHEMVSGMYYLLRALAEKNRTIGQARDLLLPRLVSGELDVSELDIDTGRLDL